MEDVRERDYQNISFRPWPSLLATVTTNRAKRPNMQNQKMRSSIDSAKTLYAEYSGTPQTLMSKINAHFEFCGPLIY